MCSEMFISSKRQQSLIDQGYPFQITHLEVDKFKLDFETSGELLELLEKVLLADESQDEETIRYGSRRT